MIIDNLKFASILIIPSLLLALQVPALAQGGSRGNDRRCCIATGTNEPATAEESKWLTYMREEEKLARDVYQQLGEKWKLRIFENISRSEERHFESVGVLLTRYGVKDPAANVAPGIYVDQTLMALYNKLMAKGTASVKDALEVGLLIEQTDIEDLEVALKATSKSDIKTVYTNLLNGSLNHQEAFETTLDVLVTSP